MTKISWIKLKTEMFDDQKIQLIETLPEGDSILIVWIKLLAMAGKINDGGLIYLSKTIQYNDEMLNTIFRKSIPVIRLALQTLSSFEMIEIFETGEIAIINWEKHQNTDGLEKIKEQNRLRQAKYRKKLNERQIESTNPMIASVSDDVTLRITQHNALELELELELDKELDNNNNVLFSFSTNSKEWSKEHIAEGFELFWNKYEKKQGKLVAFKSWKKTCKEGNAKVAFDGIDKYKKHLKTETWKTQKQASVWLNQKNWEDEYAGQEEETDLQHFGVEHPIPTRSKEIIDYYRVRYNDLSRIAKGNQRLRIKMMELSTEMDKPSAYLKIVNEFSELF